MYLFLLFALPILYYIFTTLKALQSEKSQNSVQELENTKFSKGFMFIIGTLIAIIYSFVDFFTAYAYRTAQYNVLSNFTYFLLSMILVPMAICALILFLLSKDSWKFKLQNFTPMIVGFYTLFLPYEVISKNSSFDYFLLFIVPILFISMILLQEYALDLIQALLSKSIKKIAILISVCTIILALLFPSLIYSLYYTEILTMMALILVVLFIGGTITLHIYSEKIKVFLSK